MFIIVNIKMSQTKKGQNISLLIKFFGIVWSPLVWMFFLLTVGFTLLQRTVIHGERSYVLAGCSPSGKCFLYGFFCVQTWRFKFFLVVI